MRDHNYFVYILTNKNKTALYTGVTNDLSIRLKQHIEGDSKFSFTLRYKCFYLVYYEHYKYIEHAIDREKEIKGWSRAKKNALIEIENKNWHFLNDDVIET
ncbi:GIY-YIG nuclease family protein [Pedobacter sp. LMG 31464]|uniref:GIY-YIG nuclease family protein n=1 Tax=Pedobacter planticolens TaxID=2679964 RepID=A0A923DYZ5_9SPHI|nr:GIY-YIG nuclease family protein [Pedobacter planticolens]MBB2144564.1 GIY-YIG nuclease family protein [Pedobacter planticolens]